ncbi:hypothetical protein [Streptomyces sp. gCLA4]|uniref:hypothetical protein n=1 Tax=Streptomyces sp. gCLA4 TaxID=1873416 RepID=UPI001603FCA3|nr:hypothetical protein [Streptomyces sp. gCLA4]
MTTRVESNSYLTDEQQQVYQLRESLERNGGNPVGFLSLLAAVLRDDAWRKIPSGVNQEEPFEDFADFIQAKPPFGLGSSVDHVRVLLRLRHPEEGVPRIREEMDVMRAAVRDLLGPDPADYQQDALWNDPSSDPESADSVEEPDLNLSNPVDRDAFELRSVGKFGGWVWALKVARNVQVDKDHGGDRKSDQRNERYVDPVQKVSANEFARRIGWSTPRVMRYYRAWERGIEKHALPDFAQLQPGMDVPLPSASTWTECFTPGRVRPDRTEALSAGARESGISPTQVINAAKHPGAMKAAILSDESTADAARTALLERAREDGDLRTALARTIAHDPVFRKETAVESRKAERADYVRQVAEQGKVRTPAGQALELPEQAKTEAAKLVVVVDDPQATPEAVSEAYEAVQQLIAEEIEANPEVKTAEQRARVHKMLNGMAKSIASVREAPLADIADDELIREVSELRASVDELAALVAPQQGSHLRVVETKAV